MVWLGQYKVALFLLLVGWCNVVYAQNAHVFGDDFAKIQPITALVTAVSIILGVTLRWILGQPDPNMPTGKRGVVAQILFGVAGGFIAFVACEQYRYGWLNPGQGPRQLLDGIQALAIIIGSYNNKAWLEKVSKLAEEGLTALANRWINKRTGE